MKKFINSVLISAFISSAFLFAAGYYYKGLGSDGGWYSYPALSLSRGGSAVENLETIGKLESTEGVKTLFGFKTYASVRTLYTMLWFKYVSRSIYFLKILSLVELLALFTCVYFLIRKFCTDKTVAIILLALFINDKNLILNAAGDFRPDNILACFACLTFLALIPKEKAISLISAVCSGCLLMLIHPTAAVPFACITGFFIFQNIFSKRFSLKDNYKYVIFGICGVLVFMYRGVIFENLFLTGSEIQLAEGANLREGLFRALGEGLPSILSKEIYRWKTYFFISNAAQLIVLVIALALFFRQPRSLILRDKTGLAILSSIILGFILFAVLDPHRSDMHVIPIIPFFFVMLSHTMKSCRKNVTYIILGLVCFSILSSTALAGKIIIRGKRSGYNIRTASIALNEIFRDKNHEYMIAGPAEIWPFIEEDKNVLIIDKTRTGQGFNMLEPVIDSIDYLVVNRDYSRYRWEERFLQHFQEKRLDRITRIGGGEEFIKIFEIGRKQSPDD